MKNELLKELKQDVKELSSSFRHDRGMADGTIYLGGYPTTQERFEKVWDRLEKLEKHLKVKYVPKTNKEIDSHYEKITK